MIAHVDITDRPPAGKHVVLDYLVRRSDAEDGDIGLGPVLPDDIGDGDWPAGLHADRYRLWYRSHYCLGVRFGDARPPLQPAPLLVIEQSDANRGATDLERVRADECAGQVLLHVCIHSRNDRHDGDQKCHRDDDAEQREERAQLVDADLLERGCNYVAEAHPLISGTGGGRATKSLL